MRFIAAQGSTCLWSSPYGLRPTRTPALLDASFALSGGGRVANYMNAHDWATPEEFARRVLEARMRGDERCEALIDWCYANHQKFHRLAKANGLENRDDREEFFQTYMLKRVPKVWKAFWKKPRTGDIGRGFHDYLIRSYINAVWAERERLQRRERRFPRANPMIHAIDDVADTVEVEDGSDEEISAVDLLAARNTTSEADQEELDAVRESLYELTATELEVYRLTIVEGVPVRDAAKRLGKKPSCVSAHKSYAKQKLGWSVNRRVYHITTKDIDDTVAFVRHIENDPGFLQRVRDAILEDCVAALDAVLNTTWVETDLALIVDAINTDVLDVPRFCTPEDLAPVFGEPAIAEFEELPPWQHVRITRLVLDHFLCGTLRRSRNKVQL